MHKACDCDTGPPRGGGKRPRGSYLAKNLEDKSDNGCSLHYFPTTFKLIYITNEDNPLSNLHTVCRCAQSFIQDDPIAWMYEIMNAVADLAQPGGARGGGQCMGVHRNYSVHNTSCIGMSRHVALFLMTPKCGWVYTSSKLYS